MRFVMRLLVVVVFVVPVGASEQNESNDRVARQLSRRKTVTARLEEGSGLSDSHGGHWLVEEEETSDGNNRISLLSDRYDYDWSVRLFLLKTEI